jgi:hypothetical protein
MKPKIFLGLIVLVVNVNGQTTNTNTFPPPIVGEASSPSHIDPVMYVKDYHQYGSVDHVNYAQTIRFVKHEDEIYIVSYVYNPKVEDKDKRHFGYWAKLETNSDYMCMTNNKNLDERFYINDNTIAIRNPVYFGGYKSCYRNAGFRLIESKSGTLKSNESHCLLIPVTGSYHDHHSTAFDTLALVPERDLSKWLHSQYTNGINQGRYDIAPLSFIYRYSGGIRKISAIFN